MLVTLVLLGVSLLDKSLVVLIKNVYVGTCPLLTLSDMVALGREGVRKWILRGCSAESTRTNEGSDRETPDASTINRCWWKEPREANATLAVYAAKLQDRSAQTPRTHAKHYSPW